jgi:hypothetical protein
VVQASRLFFKKEQEQARRLYHIKKDATKLVAFQKSCGLLAA